MLLGNNNNKTKAEIFLKHNAKARVIEEQLKTVKKEADRNKGSQILSVMTHV